MPKLPEGMRKLYSGRIEYRFRYEGKTYSVTADTVTECKARAEKRLQKLTGSRRIDSDVITMDSYYKIWENALSSRVRPSTLHSYNMKYQQVSKRIGSKRVKDVTRQDLIALQASLANELQTATVNYLMSMTRSMLEDAVADGIIDRNPYTRIKGLKRTEPKARDTIHKAMTESELEAFFRHSQKSWYHELFRFLLLTGMRVGEAGALTWEDIDDSIHIHKTVSRVSSTEYTVSKSGKTEAATRDIPLTDEVRTVLRAQKWKVLSVFGPAYARKGSFIFMPEVHPDRILTSSAADHAMDSVLKRMEKAGEGIGRRSVHCFRDTFATIAIAQGMSPLTLKEILGHEDIKMTLGLYAQVVESVKEDEMKKLRFS